MTTAKFIAITDETSVCECCGKSNLKRVVVLELADGRIVRYGTDCASKAMLVKKATTSVALDVLKFVQKWELRYSKQELADKWIGWKLGMNARMQGDELQVLVGDRKHSEWVTIGG